jgi:ribonuclease P protein component
MFPKRNRSDNAIINQIFTKSRFINSSNLTVRFILNTKYSSPHISFIVPKTTSKKAVERNLLKRRGYSVLSKYLNRFPVDFLGVFIFNKKSLIYFGLKGKNKLKNKESIQNLENEIKNILNKVN